MVAQGPRGGDGPAVGKVEACPEAMGIAVTHAPNASATLPRAATGAARAGRCEGGCSGASMPESTVALPGSGAARAGAGTAIAKVPESAAATGKPDALLVTWELAALEPTEPAADDAEAPRGAAPPTSACTAIAIVPASASGTTTSRSATTRAESAAC